MKPLAQDAPLGARVAAWGRLPGQLRVLFISGGTRAGAWLAEAFAADRAVAVALEEAVGAAAGVARLREERFDAVLAGHEPPELDSLELVEALRAAEAEEPIILLGAASAQELEPLAYEVGADGYLCVHTATTRGLIWLMARAVERHQLIRENRRLAHADRRRLEQELRDAEQLLERQRSLVDDLESLGRVSSESHDSLSAVSLPFDRRRPASRLSAADCSLPEPLVKHYRELLRAYVMMGSGNIASEMNALGELFAGASISAAETMQLHLMVLEELVGGLGNRSARHVMSRADFLALEMMVHLAEGYRRRLAAASPVASTESGSIRGVTILGVEASELVVERE